jgi:chemotaxis protein MotA
VDLATIIGLVIAFSSLVIMAFLEGTHLSSLFSAPAMIVIFGGTLGAVLVGYRKGDIRKLPSLLKSAFVSNETDPQELIDGIVRMAEKARREGLLALQDDVGSLDHPLLIRGVQLIVDGTDPEIVKSTMETQVELTEERQMNTAGMLDAAGGYSPTLGIIGTVIGLVHVLGNMGEPDQLAASISVAFLATLWGILAANLIFLPLGSKVKQNIQYQSLVGRMCIAGVSGLQTGEAPRALREKLEVFFSESSTRTRSGKRGGDEE